MENPAVATKQCAGDESSDFLSYPRSRASTTSDSPIVRSRTWSEDITKHWKVTITGLETFSERAQRYLVYLKMTPAQLKCVHDKMLAEIRTGLELHRQDPRAQWELAKCSLKMADTHIDDALLPKGTEKGSSVALDFASMDGTKVRAVKVDLQGNGAIATSEVEMGLRDQCSQFPKGVLERNATASMLFDCFASLIKRLHEEKGIPVPDDTAPVGFSVGFPTEQRGIARASLVHWTKGFETGRKTNDPVEGMDMDALLDCAFWRAGINAKTVALLNDTTGTMLACAYEKPATLPPCRVGFLIGSGVNGCYVQPDAQGTYGYHGSIINCEIGSFDKSLPVNDVDLEVDFADEANDGVQLFEKIVAASYLGEQCRRLVVKVWQSEAPQLGWVRNSLPWQACARVIEDTGDNLDVTNEILLGLWEWETTLEQRRAVRQLFEAVFERSAALSAVAIVALSTQTGRLQPALGGITCAISGALYSKCASYRRGLEHYMKLVLPEGTADCIKLYEVHDGAARGAGILGVLAREV